MVMRGISALLPLLNMLRIWRVLHVLRHRVHHYRPKGLGVLHHVHFAGFHLHNNDGTVGCCTLASGLELFEAEPRRA
jgi:hypothetical protein